MNEKKYLFEVLRIVESKNRLRMLFYYQLSFVLLSSLFLCFAVQIELISHQPATLFLGLVMGFFIAKTEMIFNFKYLIKHLNGDSIKKWLSNNGV